jgi:hypothetical protein
MTSRGLSMLEVIEALQLGYWKEDLPKDIMYLPTMLLIGLLERGSSKGHHVSPNNVVDR